LEDHTADYTLKAADHGKFLRAMTAMSFTLPPLASVETGWSVRLCRAKMPSPIPIGNTIEIYPASGDALSFSSDEGLPSLRLAGDGDFVECVSTGANWVCMGDIGVHLNAYPDWPLNEGGQVIDGSGLHQKVQYASLNRDTHSGFNTQLSEYTVPLSGQYLVRVGGLFQTGAGADYRANLALSIEGVGRLLESSTVVPADNSYTTFDQVTLIGSNSFSRGDVLTITASIYHGGTTSRIMNDDNFINENPNMAIWQMTRLGNRW